MPVCMTNSHGSGLNDGVSNSTRIHKIKELDEHYKFIIDKVGYIYINKQSSQCAFRNGNCCSNLQRTGWQKGPDPNFPGRCFISSFGRQPFSLNVDECRRVGGRLKAYPHPDHPGHCQSERHPNPRITSRLRCWWRCDCGN